MVTEEEDEGEEGEGPAIGIDFGTCNARVAVCRNGRVEMIPNEYGSFSTPCYVAFPASGCHVVGESAKEHKDVSPENIVFGIKRLLGMDFSDVSFQSDINLWPFEVLAGVDDSPIISMLQNGKENRLSAEQVTTFILMKMRTIAENYLKCKIKHAVIGVPAYFNTFQRQAIKDAGVLAGLNIMRIVNEPSAAAIPYCIKKTTGNALVVDFGGGHSDISVIAIKENSVDVKANAGDVHLGGEDFNNKMLSYFIQEFWRMHREDISVDTRALLRLRTECELAKKLLSIKHKAIVKIEKIFGGIDLFSTITRSKFEELNEDLFKRCMLLVEKCLRNAKMDKGSIDHIILAGGSTKMPQFDNFVQKIFGKEKILRVINPEEAVAYGTSILAAILSQGNGVVQDLCLSELTTFTIGTDVAESIMKPLIRKGTPLPARSAFCASPLCDPARAWITVYQGDASHVRLCKLLSISSTSSLKPNQNGSLLVCVHVEIDNSGILNLSVEDKVCGERQIITVNKDVLHNTLRRVARLLKCPADEVWLSMIYKWLLKTYCHEIYYTIDILAIADKNKIYGAIQETTQWIEQNQFAGADMFKAKKEELVNIILEAEKNQCENEQKQKLESKKLLVKYCHVLSTKSAWIPIDKKIKDAIANAIKWMDENQLADSIDYDIKRKELLESRDPISENPTSNNYAIFGNYVIFGIFLLTGAFLYEFLNEVSRL